VRNRSQAVSPDLHSLATDAVIATPAITAPWWLPAFNSGVQELMLVGGLFLLMVRIAVALRDLFARRRRRTGDFK
jgi:uncharacterized protein involved in exopolysaccharide biosynthesis